MSFNTGRNGSKDMRFITFKQAQENNWHVKKGERGTHILLWKPTMGTDENGKQGITSVLQRVFTVFHATQIEGIPEYQAPEVKVIAAYEKAEKIIADSGADIRFGGNEAFYKPAGDYIQMPPKGDFKSQEGTIQQFSTSWPIGAGEGNA